MDDSRGRRIIECVGLGAASLLVLASQIAVTRVLSLKYAANQTFLVVSFAVLGLAVGAAIVAALARRWSAERLRDLPAIGMAVFALAMLAAVVTLHLNWPTGPQIVVVPLPYVGVGVCISALFARRAAQAGVYYACDLLGAATGAVIATPLLDVMSAPVVLMWCVPAGFVAALLFAPRPWRGRVQGAIGLGTVVGAALIAIGAPASLLGPVPIYPAPIKDMLNYIERGSERAAGAELAPRLERSRWSSFGRTDVVNDVAPSQRKMLFIDGAAGTAMFADPDTLNQNTMTELMRFGPRVALSLLPPERKRQALAIGAGGGRDVLACRLGGAGSVVAVELNHDLVDIVRESSAFNGGIYDADAPGVQVEVGEGRHYLRSSAASFDVIVLSIPVTKRGEGYGGFALSESYLFTVESIGEYLEHLNRGGLLVIVCHTEQEVGRLINTYLAHAARGGMEPVAAMRRVAVFGDGLITVVIGTPGVDPTYWMRLDATARAASLAQPQRRWYFTPELSARADSSGPLLDVAQGRSPQVIFERKSTSPFEPDYSAVTDDRPFFYFFTRSLPPLVSTVLGASGAALVVMLLWGVRYKPGGAASPAPAGAGERLLWRLSVAGLGAGFMLAEIPLIQRFVFLFGHPTLALGLLLGSLLLATGIGSFVSAMFIRGRLSWTWPFPVVLGLFLLFGFEPVQRELVAGATGEFGDALLRAVAMAAPLGVIMGVPFPMLLTAARKRGAEISIAAMWGVNGVAGVVGSAAAIAVAMLWGYSYAFMLAGACYVGTAVVVVALARLSGRATGAAAG